MSAPDPAVTVGAVLADTGRRLRAAGIDAAPREARLLLAHVLESDATALLAFPERPVGPAQRRAVAALAARRAGRAPMAQLLGRREFWSLPLAVTPAVLTPRPESETLVAAALDRLPDRDRAWRLLDLGTGSGCLLLALLRELPAASGTGVDCSAAAAAVARRNAAMLGLAGRARFVVADWAAAPPQRCDLVVCNPPYVETGAIAGLDPEVAAHEPRQAIDGGADGLACWRAVLPAIAARLGPAGLAAVELGAGQRPAVAALARSAGLAALDVRRDLAGTERALILGPHAPADRRRRRRGSAHGGDRKCLAGARAVS